MLISVSVIAVVMTVVYAAYTSNIEAIEEGRFGSATDQAARIVLDQICRDLQSAYLGTPPSDTGIRMGMIGMDLEKSGRRADRLDFTSLSHMVLDEGDPSTDLCEVGYFLEEDEGETEDGPMILYRRDSPVVDEDITTGGQVLELCNRVGGLDIVYLDNQGREYESWTTLESPHHDTLPSAVRVSLVLLDHRGRERPFRTTIRPELASLSH